MKSYSIKCILVFTLLFSLKSCVEPFDIESETFESALVIEGTITNENKQQEILLSRTFELDAEGPNPESGAEVTVEDNAGNTYAFQEEEDGLYKSIQSFSAISGKTYQLKIRTRDGRNYSSEPEELTSESSINNLNAVRSKQLVDGAEKDGVAITAEPNSANSKFYRYSYVETYKFQSRYDVPNELVIINGRVEKVAKEKQDHICYITKNSNEILVSSKEQLNGAENKLPIKFVSIENQAISYRYSILVKQYSLTREAYNFYEILNELSGSESLFSQNQPGFINGNVYSEENENEKVLGYFSISAVDSQRLFFNFTDFFDESERPPYPYSCEIKRPKIDVLFDNIDTNSISLIGEAPESADDEGIGPYRVVPRNCVDCTVFGSNEKPDFWED